MVSNKEGGRGLRLGGGGVLITNEPRGCTALYTMAAGSQKQGTSAMGLGGYRRPSAELRVSIRTSQHIA